MTRRGIVIRTTIKIHGKPKKRKEILQTIRYLSELSLNSKGCLKTEISPHVDDKDTLYFFSDWATEKGLKEYEKSKLMAVLLGLQFLLLDVLQIDTHFEINRRDELKKDNQRRQAEKKISCVYEQNTFADHFGRCQRAGY
jgi:quinol monooxygenase YgiN